MKKIMKVLALVLALTVLFSFTACNDEPGKQGDTYVLTIYRARSSGMSDGVRDEAVKQAIEDKFYKDTGISISLDVQLYTNTAITDIVDVNYNNKNKNIDGIFHYLSEDAGSAITKYAKSSDGAAMNLDPILEQYGQNILAKINENDVGHLADRSGYFNIDGTYTRTALSGFSKEGGFGILMRKDLMRNVQSVTGLDPEDYDINNDGFKSMTVSEFESVMRAIKADTSNDVSTPVNGAPWDLMRVVATSFGVSAMSGYGLDANGKFVPAQFTPNWDKYVDLMYNWANEGIWEQESNNTTDDQRQTNLIAGTAAAYLAYPTAEQLIMLSKKFYAANTGSEELMVIAPFASEDNNGKCLYNPDGSQVVNGNLKTQRSFYGGIIPYRSKNSEILIQYIDWMYSSAENYELCLYGVKGTDWIEGDVFTYGGNSYKTWEYPSEKVDEYLLKPPYTGKYMLLENINVSNRICGHYSTNEKKWYTSLYFDFPQYGDDQIEGIWLPEPTREYGSIASNIDGEYVDNIRSYAWVGRKNNGKTPLQILNDYVAQYRANNANYFNYLDQEYRNTKAYFESKYAD